jgi:hypothetical protein
VAAIWQGDRESYAVLFALEARARIYRGIHPAIAGGGLTAGATSAFATISWVPVSVNWASCTQSRARVWPEAGQTNVATTRIPDTASVNRIILYFVSFTRRLYPRSNWKPRVLPVPPQRVPVP